LWPLHRSAILLGGEAEKIAGLGFLRVARNRPFEGSLGFGGHDSTGCGRFSLTQIGFTSCSRAVELHGLLARLHRVIEAPKPGIDRSEHFPAGAVIGARGQMRLDLADQTGDRFVAFGRGDARESGLARNVRRSERNVEAERTERQNSEGRDRGRTPALGFTRAGCRNAGAGRRFRRGQQTARDLEPCRLGLGLPDQAAGAIAVDFLELVLIDREVAAARQRPRGAPKRPDNGQNRRRGHQCKNDP